MRDEETAIALESALRILVVEDDVDTRANMCDILELDSHEAEVAGTAAEARLRMQAGGLDVVILDRKLPDGTAETLLPQLQTLAPSTDIIVITGYADLDSTIAALRNRAADYILKPVNPEALRASLKRISERRRIEHELHGEHEFASQIFATAEAVVLVLDLEGNILRFNPYLTKITGWSLDEVLGRDWFEVFLPSKECERVRDFFQKTARGIETRGIVNGILTKQGQERQMRWSNTTLKDEHGETTAVLAVGLDVTDVTEAQKRALQSERLAAIGQTMTALAHESRNSLQRIQASAEILELELEGQPQALNDIKSIQRATKDLHCLLEEIRTFAAPLNLQLEACLVSSIWRRAWEHLPATPARVEARILENLGEADCRLMLDSLRMEQVFRNLFENSLTAFDGPVIISISCRAIPKQKHMKIIVGDNGPGLNIEQKERLFDAFYTTKTTGTGLGLAIARRIVEAHGGTIRVDEGIAQGAQFILTLPMDALPN